MDKDNAGKQSRANGVAAEKNNAVRISYYGSSETDAVMSTLGAVPMTGRCTSTSTSCC